MDELAAAGAADAGSPPDAIAIPINKKNDKTNTNTGKLKYRFNLFTLFLLWSFI